MPWAIATSRISLDEARRMVSDSISGEIGMTSCSAIRPRYPVLAQLRQPSGR